MEKKTNQVSFFGQKIQIGYLIAAVVLVVVIAAWIFWVKVYDNSTKVFNGMLERSLTTSSFSKAVTQQSSGEIIKQYVTLEMGSYNRSRTIINVEQGSDNIVQTESIGTPSSDYARYREVKTSQIGANGKPISFNSVIGIWGKSSPQNGQTTTGTLFNQSILNVVPIANLTAAQREQIMHMISSTHVYQIVGSPKKNPASDRPQYIYDLKVNTPAFINMIRQFGDDVGLSQLGNVDGSSFTSSVAEFHVTVDVLSRQLISDNEVGSGRTENFSGYGANTNISIPTNSIPISQLEAKLQTIQ